MANSRIYGTIAAAAVLAVAAVLVAPALVATVVEYLPAPARVPGGRYVPLAIDGVRATVVIVAAIIIGLVLRDRGRAEALEEVGLGGAGEVEVYRGFTREVGLDPSVVRQVIDINSQMDGELRESDFRRANQPNFSAELGYRLGVDSETREMMREFFATAATDSRRSFSTTTHVVVEGGRIERSHGTEMLVEPTSRYAPRDPDSDPNWTGEVTEQELHAKIFRGWGDDDELEADGPDGPVFVGSLPDSAGQEIAVAAGDVAIWPGEDPEGSEMEEEEDEGEAWIEAPAAGTGDALAWAMEEPAEEPASAEAPLEQGLDTQHELPSDAVPSGVLDFDDEGIFASVRGDPVIDGLIRAMELARRLPATEDLRYLYVFYGSESTMLVTEFHSARSSHAEDLGTGMEPLFRYAGVRRHQTRVWQVELATSATREDDLGAIVWIPVGIAQLGDLWHRRAWKLVAVRAGTSRTFHALAESFALAGARMEWILGNLYGDLRIERGGETLRYLLPGLGVSIDLAVAEALEGGDDEIHGDGDVVAGPPESEVVDLALLGDLGRKFFTTRLGAGELAHQDWLALLNMTTTLLMRNAPVTSKELLGQWATPESVRGADLIADLGKIFGTALTGDDGGWALSNVRLDLFWIDEALVALATARDPELIAALSDFFVDKFDPGSLAYLVRLGAMDPRMRSADALGLERLAVRVLGEAVDLLGPNASGKLAENLALVASATGKG